MLSSKATMFPSSAYFGHVALVRLLLQRGMAAVYLVAFLTVALQGKPLIGERGLLPAAEFLRRVGFWEAPSLFHWRFSDAWLMAVAWVGVGLAVLALVGWMDAGAAWVSVAGWLGMYALYLSVVNVGQNFWGFGWESMLVEAGFFAAFLGPRWMTPSVVPVLVLRWMLFRTEMGAGLIKLRHDPCWRKLTCLDWHYETQPLPNPLSWYCHWMPKWVHRSGVVFSHFVQVVCPLGLLAPQPVAAVCAGLCVAQQVWLIVTGNYSWLNWLTVVIGVAGFSDEVFARVGLHVGAGALVAMPAWWVGLMWVVGLGVVALSVQPVMNLFSPRQAMNASYNNFRLVNTYGAFGSVTRERHELVFEGTMDAVETAATEWKEYAFKAKPGDVIRRPRQVAPYHLRLDWMVWFLPFTVVVTGHGVHVNGYQRWTLRFVKRLLEADRGVLGLMGEDPFAGARPGMVRVRFYKYSYTTPATRKATGAWWERRLLGEFLPAMDLEALGSV